jgi:hypothetical protein
LSFAASLARRGHAIKYLSPHSSLEHGKDLVSVGEGQVHAFQPKAGSINTAAWRAIAEEVREAAIIPVEVPGMARKVADRAHLVLSGRITDPVRNKISLMNADLTEKGYSEIDVIDVDQLVPIFRDAFASFFPSAIQPTQELLRLYLRDGRGPQDKASLCRILALIAGNASIAKGWKRALSNVAIAAEFVSSTYRVQANHISLVDTWIVAASQILRVAGSRNLADTVWRPSLELCAEAIAAAGDDLVAEILDRKDFIEGYPLFDIVFIANRKTIALGYAAAVINARMIRGNDVRADAERLAEVTTRELPWGAWGEAAWNYQLNVAIALSRIASGALLGEQIVNEWLGFVCPSRAPWPRDPYWTVESALSLRALQDDRERPTVELSRTSYTASAAVDFLARRMRRQTLSRRWADVSRFQLASVKPDKEWMEFEWQIDAAAVELRSLPATGSWQELRLSAFQARSTLFCDQDAWLLPYFLCAYPHRTASWFAGELDYRTSDEAGRAEWDHANVPPA